MGIPQFDVVFHLLGEQAIPVFICTKLFDKSDHVYFVTQKTIPIVTRIENALGSSVDQITTIKVNPYDISSMHRIFQEQTKKYAGKALGFDCTGGTKPMFAALLNTSKMAGARAFYLNSTGRTLDFLTPDYQSIPFDPVFSSVEEFVKLAGYNPKKPSGVSTPRHERQSELVSFCWKHRVPISKIQSKLSKLSDKPRTVFSVTGKNISASLDKDLTAKISTGGEIFVLENFPHFARFLAGGWLEEYVYSLLSPLLSRGRIRHLVQNMTVKWPEQSSGSKKKDLLMIAQELDVVFTDGYGLFVIECKAGSIQQNHVQKLQNLTERLGGSFGKGIFAASGSQRPAVISRLRNTPHISSFIRNAINLIPEKYSTLKSGEVIQP